MSADEFKPADEHPFHKLKVTMTQRIIACRKCDARYSDRLEKCPECGEPRDDTAAVEA